MLKGHVCLGRKISRGYNSSNYSVSIEADIPANADQADEVQRHLRRLFQLAQQSLDREIDRDQAEQAVGRRDEEPASNGRHQPPQNDRGYQPNGNGQGSNGQSGNGQQAEPASHKQINYIHNLAKKQSLSKQQLDGVIQSVIGQVVAVDQLTKREAGRVIEALTNNTATNGRR